MYDVTHKNDVLLFPWNLIERFRPRAIKGWFKHVYQRYRYGVSYKDAWCLDIYLMKVIFNGVKVLRDDSANIVDWDYEQPGGFTRTTMNEFLSKLKGRIDRYDAYDETPDELDAGYKVDAELFTELGEKLHSLWW